MQFIRKSVAKISEEEEEKETLETIKSFLTELDLLVEKSSEEPSTKLFFKCEEGEGSFEYIGNPACSRGLAELVYGGKVFRLLCNKNKWTIGTYGVIIGTEMSRDLALLVKDIMERSFGISFQKKGG